MMQSRIDAQRPDIIHVHNFVPIASPAVFFVAKRNKIPVVLTLHNYRLICPSATLFHNGKIYERSVHSWFPFDAVLKGVYRDSIMQTAALAVMMVFHNLIGTWKYKVNTFIVLTEFARTRFLDAALRVSAQNFLLKPNFIPDPGKGPDDRDNTFLYVGRLSKEKGIETLLKAFRLTDASLTILGDGPMRKEVEASAATSPNIRYLGFQKKDVILEYLKKSTALIFPSVWFEGFPITILEAFATGTPVVGSKIGSIAEIVTDNFNGLHFAPGKEHELVRKIDQLRQPGLAKKLSDNARQTYELNYTPEKNYKTLMDIYHHTISTYTR
jgi:glycosyltransferase involved in cell wall biosynthesis